MSQSPPMLHSPQGYSEVLKRNLQVTFRSFLIFFIFGQLVENIWIWFSGNDGRLWWYSIHESRRSHAGSRWLSIFTWRVQVLIFSFIINNTHDWRGEFIFNSFQQNFSFQYTYFHWVLKIIQYTNLIVDLHRNKKSKKWPNNCFVKSPL